MGFLTWGEKYYYEKGINQGAEDTELKNALALVDHGMPVDEVAKVLGLPKEKILGAK